MLCSLHPDDDGRHLVGRSLQDVLCRLYKYQIRLHKQFRDGAKHEGRNVAAEKGDPEDDARFWLVEGENRLRERLRESGQPVECSRAWQYAVRWLGKKAPSVSNLTELLGLHCRLLLFERAVRAQKEKSLRHLGEGQLHVFWERLTNAHGELRQLAHEIDQLDKRGAGDELVREVRDRFPEEADDAGLHHVPKTFIGGEAANEPAEPRVQPAHARAAASYEWVCTQRPGLIPTARGAKYSQEQLDFIRDNECPAYRDSPGVPAYETWKRQVRQGQADQSKPRASPRSGRTHGTSIVKANQV